MQPGDVVLGYARVSTEEQGQSGLGLDSQREAIQQECLRRGWVLSGVYSDIASGKNVRRPGLQHALSLLKQHEATGLVVAKLDRLSRSVVDFGQTLEMARKQGWNLDVLDLGIDLASPMGEAMANVAATFAQLERRLISERTKTALRQAKARGVHVGGRKTISEQVRADVRVMAEAGKPQRWIAAYTGLHRSAVQRILHEVA